MQNLIYQYWDGVITCGCKAGVNAMETYAKRINAAYLFEDNPQFIKNKELGRYSPHYGAFKPIYDNKFYQYDNVLFADTDVFPVEGLKENIFENFNSDIGICSESFQPKFRLTTSGEINSKNDEKWATAIKNRWRVDMPRTEGLLKVYNSGVVLYSNKGLKKAKENFVPFKEYVNLVNSLKLPSFYTCDQPYLHAMLKVAKLDWLELDPGWNSYVHYIGDPNMKPRPVNDMRTKDTKFVHIQLRCADNFDEQKLWRITNLPVKDWGV